MGGGRAEADRQQGRGASLTIDVRTRSALRAAFSPRAVAVVGASDDPTKLAGMPVRNLLANGFAGRVYPVNPSRDEVAGVRCYASVADIPEELDAAFIILPAALSVQAARECAARGAKAAIIASSGFAESATEEGRSLQRELRDVARATGMRIIGPNSNGLYNAVDRVALGFNSAHATRIAAGRLSVVSHSGALFAVIAGRIAELGVGLSSYVTAGNEGDLAMLDYLEFFLDDEHTDAILLVIESIGDGARLRALAAEARRRGKHLVSLKIGTSPQGQAATLAHSSRMAGNARAYVALLEQARIPLTRTVEAAVTAATLMLGTRARGGDRIAVMSVSGAGGALTADAASRVGVRLADLTPETRAGLDRLRRFSPVLNPVDIGAIGSENAPPVVRLLARDEQVAAIVFYVYQLQRSRDTRFALAKACVEEHASSGKCFVVIAPGGIDEAEREIYRSANIPILADTEATLDAVGALIAERRAAPDDAALLSLDVDLADVLPATVGVLDEAESRLVLEKAGVPLVASETVRSADEAARAAERFGGPVAVKGVVAGQTHKSDAGLVLLDMTGGAAAAEAFEALGGRARSAGGRLEAALVQPMIRGRLEALAGVTREPGVGHVLVAGLGGVFAESLDDLAVWHIPASEGDVREGLARTRLGRVIASRRWGATDTFDRLVEVLMKLQALVRDTGERIAAIDVNPLVLSKDGVVAVDARVVTRT